jgi:hypothetical protein
MIVHRHFHVTPRLHQLPRQLNVRLTRRRIAAGVIMDDDDRGSPRAIARFITSRTCIDASSTDPRYIASLAIRMFFALRNNTRTSSTGEWAMAARR